MTNRDDGDGIVAPGSPSTYGLTPREVMVLDQMRAGLTAMQIARRLAISPKTVENHKIRIYSKLGARNQSEAVAIGMLRGLASAKPARAAMSDQTSPSTSGGRRGLAAPGERVTSPRVLIGDADRASARRLTRVCRGRDLTVIGVHSTVEGLREATESDQPDVVVLSDSLADRLVDNVLPALVDSGAQVIVLSRNMSVERMMHVLDQGASGYLTARAKPQQIADAVIAVAGGGAAIQPEVAGVMLGQWRLLRTHVDRAAATLSRREKDVLTAMAEGLPTKAIARQLGVAHKTVESHKIRVFDKLGAHSQAHAVSIAIAQHLIEPDDRRRRDDRRGSAEREGNPVSGSRNKE
jgi:DNA-binding NarL/FixJ family response regulator